MAGVEKIVEKMNRQPHGIRFEEIAKVLNYFGCIKVRSDGSHHHSAIKTAMLLRLKRASQ
jgi:hypothetical protein